MVGLEVGMVACGWWKWEHGWLKSRHGCMRLVEVGTWLAEEPAWLQNLYQSGNINS